MLPCTFPSQMPAADLSHQALHGTPENAVLVCYAPHTFMVLRATSAHRCSPLPPTRSECGEGSPRVPVLALALTLAGSTASVPTSHCPRYRAACSTPGAGRVHVGSWSPCVHVSEAMSQMGAWSPPRETSCLLHPRSHVYGAFIGHQTLC